MFSTDLSDPDLLRELLQFTVELARGGGAHSTGFQGRFDSRREEERCRSSYQIGQDCRSAREGQDFGQVWSTIRVVCRRTVAPLSLSLTILTYDQF
jgi:hypothetical protein